ncbi:MAG TPA: RNA 2',3'-cyclic phosphodiesterase [Pyrinomonadaceae bacterium]|nr:RNA 2',3'-cyclic phosphodiesterase [Pyrinomonadaceae bacterium]
MSGLRLFCAIELPQDIRALAADFITRLREAAPDVRASWEREEKLHLTLKFFGDTEESRVEPLTGALERAASGLNPFELGFQGTGAFPPSGLPRVLWLGVRDPLGNLIALHRQMEDACAAAGFERERKRFHPHLTIARLRSPEGAKRLAGLHKAAEFETESFTVTEIVLIKSELLPQGSRYTKLSSHRLRATS